VVLAVTGYLVRNTSHICRSSDHNNFRERLTSAISTSDARDDFRRRFVILWLQSGDTLESAAISLNYIDHDFMLCPRHGSSEYLTKIVWKYKPSQPCNKFFFQKFANHRHGHDQKSNPWLAMCKAMLFFCANVARNKCNIPFKCFI
jgi:hypothetical protein